MVLEAFVDTFRELKKTVNEKGHFPWFNKLDSHPESYWLEMIHCVEGKKYKRLANNKRRKLEANS